MVGYRRVFVLGESTRPGKWIYNISRVYNLSERLIHYCTISHSDIVLNTVQQAFEHCKDFKPLRRGTNRKKPKLHNLVSTLFEVFLYLFCFYSWHIWIWKSESKLCNERMTLHSNTPIHIWIINAIRMTYNLAACKNIDKHWTFFFREEGKVWCYVVGILWRLRLFSFH